MQYFRLEEILQLHYLVVKDFGGLHSIRDEGRLKSVVEAPMLEAFGVEQYQTVHQKAAVYARNIISDHPFVDGNKRSGITCMAVFLGRNGVILGARPKDLEDFAVKVAVDYLNVDQIADWLQLNSKPSNE
jgi:death-on-curing protein